MGGMERVYWGKPVSCKGLIGALSWPRCGGMAMCGGRAGRAGGDARRGENNIFGCTPAELWLYI